MDLSYFESWTVQCPLSFSSQVGTVMLNRSQHIILSIAWSENLWLLACLNTGGNAYLCKTELSPACGFQQFMMKSDTNREPSAYFLSLFLLLLAMGLSTMITVSHLWKSNAISRVHISQTVTRKITSSWNFHLKLTVLLASFNIQNVIPIELVYSLLL